MYLPKFYIDGITSSMLNCNEVSKLCNALHLKNKQYKMNKKTQNKYEVKYEL